MHTENLKSPRAPRRDHAPSRLRVAVSLQFLIATGDGLAGVALAVRVYQQTHSPWAVTAVLLAAGLPVVLLAPLAGMLLDRVRIGFALVPAAAGMAVAAVGSPWSTGWSRPSLWSRSMEPATACSGRASVPPCRCWRPRWPHPGQLRAVGSDHVRNCPRPAVRRCREQRGRHAARALDGRGRLCHRALGLATLRLGRSHVPEHDGSGPARRAMSAGFAYLRADRPLRTLVLVVAVMVAFTNVSVIAELFLAEGTLHAGAAGYAPSSRDGRRP